MYHHTSDLQKKIDKRKTKKIVLKVHSRRLVVHNRKIIHLLNMFQFLHQEQDSLICSLHVWLATNGSSGQMMRE